MSRIRVLSPNFLNLLQMGNHIGMWLCVLLAFLSVFSPNQPCGIMWNQLCEIKQNVKFRSRFLGNPKFGFLERIVFGETELWCSAQNKFCPSWVWKFNDVLFIIYHQWAARKTKPTNGCIFPIYRKITVEKKRGCLGGDGKRRKYDVFRGVYFGEYEMFNSPWPQLYFRCWQQ